MVIEGFAGKDSPTGAWFETNELLRTFADFKILFYRRYRDNSSNGVDKELSVGLSDSSQNANSRGGVGNAPLDGAYLTRFSKQNGPQR